MSELDIEVYRGNSKYLEILPLDSKDNPLMLGAMDKVIFAVKGILKTYLRKEFTQADQDVETGKISVRLSPEETMLFLPGEYVYDCLYVFSDPVIDPFTFIGPAKFIVIDTVSKLEVISDGS